MLASWESPCMYWNVHPITPLHKDNSKTRKRHYKANTVHTCSVWKVFFAVISFFKCSRLYLTQFYDLCSFSRIDHKTATRCLTSFRRHLWYLMPESTFLSLFEEKLLIDDKQLLAVNLLSQNMQSEFQQAKNNFENPNTVLSRDK